MSERGTWCTEWIYCEDCRNGFRRFLEETGADTSDPLTKYWSAKEVSPGFFAGRISGLYGNEERRQWEDGLLPLLAEQICHRMLVAVIPEAGGAVVLTVEPKTE